MQRRSWCGLAFMSVALSAEFEPSHSTHSIKPLYRDVNPLTFFPCTAYPRTRVAHPFAFRRDLSLLSTMNPTSVSRFMGQVTCLSLPCALGIVTSPDTRCDSTFLLGLLPL